MKGKIKRFSKGDFHIGKPDVRFSETYLLLRVGEGEVYEGCFTIENSKDGNIRGLVYPSSYRMHLPEEGFDGNPVQVNFTYNSVGLAPGAVEHGRFTVVCDGGEFEITYTVIVEKPYVMTAHGKIQSIEDFKQLAMRDFTEAHRLFKSRQFYDVLRYEEVRIRNLYDNMRKWSLDEQALEEFLVGIKRKERIFLTLPEGEREYRDIFESVKDSLEIHKNTWGHVPIRVTAEGDFLYVSKTAWTTDDFVGNRYLLEYVIRSERLHAGRNYGRIAVSTPYETLHMDVCVWQKGHADERRHAKGLVAGQALKEYLAFVSGRVSADVWVEKAIRHADELAKMDPQNEYYTLLKAHIYLRGKREREAAWILENVNFHRFSAGRNPETNAYFLFLNSILKKETAYTNRSLEEMERLFMKHLHSWQILCMIVNLDPKYDDRANRLRVLERQFFNGANHILLYTEAYLCYRGNVLLLRKLESFEIQILNFAVKYRLMTKELALHMADLVSRQKKYNAKLAFILEKAYDVYKEPEILRAICTQLIKGNKTDSADFKWYEMAISGEMKIARLYEYYMMSVPANRARAAFPKIVYLYFLHGINLDYTRTALLYENILTYEKEDGEIYRQYEEQMRTFAGEQLKKGRVNDSLRLIYSRLLSPRKLSPEEFDALYDICHAYEVTVKDGDVKYVLVIERDGRIKQRVACRGGKAVIHLYDKESRIVLEAADGFHYTDSLPYETRRLFQEMRFLELCRQKDAATGKDKETKPAPDVSLKTIRTYGPGRFDRQEVFRLCSKQVREKMKEEQGDDFLLYLCFELLKDGLYDMATLTYLAGFYCGATRDMKLVWRKAVAYGIAAKSLAERIITQMLFSEMLFQEEDIFEDYYTGKPYFRLKQAYLAYVARMYVTRGREMSGRIIRIMLREYEAEEYLADVCKAAILKFYAAREAEPDLMETLRTYFLEMCRMRLVFSFYLDYPVSWLREGQLHDKMPVEYHAETNGKVRIVYRLQKDEESAGEYRTETLLPMYDNVYVKEFILFAGEILHYYFEEEKEGMVIRTPEDERRAKEDTGDLGKYGRLNDILRLPEERRHAAMLLYKEEEARALRMFPQ